MDQIKVTLLVDWMLFMARINQQPDTHKHQTSGYALWNCMILLTTTVFTQSFVSHANGSKFGNKLKLIPVNRVDTVSYAAL